MGKEPAIKLYLTYLTGHYDCSIHPKGVGTDDCGVSASGRAVRYRAAR
jgi:hypothetical protein